MGLVTPWGGPEPHRISGTRVGSFIAIGLVCTAAFAVLYALLRTWVGPTAANLGALSITMALNFEANRRFTFGSPPGSIRLQAAGYAIAYLLGMAASTLVLNGLLGVVTEPGRPLETTLALTAGVAATLVRFVLLSTLVFPGLGAAAAGDVE